MSVTDFFERLRLSEQEKKQADHRAANKIDALSRRRDGVTRREFLRTGMGMSVPLFAFNSRFSWLLSLFQRPREIADGQPRILEDLTNPERERMVSEIIRFREELGLTGLPEELQTADMTLTQWGTHEDGQEVRVPENVRSYALRCLQLSQLIFGSRAALLVSGIEIDEANAGALNFDYSSRICHYPSDIRSYANLRLSTGQWLHEVTGHGSGPEGYFSGNIQIPYDALLRITHGKWRALTQAFQVPQEFFRHPADGTLQTVKLEMGRKITHLLYDGGFIFSTVTEDRNFGDEIQNKLRELSGQDDLGSIIFTNALCRQLGDWIVELLLADPQKFKLLGMDVYQAYGTAVEVALREIYAEMVRICLIPRQDLAENNHITEVQSNGEIASGIAEVLSTIRAERVDLPKMRQEILSLITDPRDPATVRWNEEEALQEATPTQQSAEEPIDFEGAVVRFYGGEFPELLVSSYAEQEKTIILDYARLLRMTMDIYPELLDWYNFDSPSMHWWHSEMLGSAANADNIRNLIYAVLKGKPLGDFLNEYNLPLRIKTLQNFLYGWEDFAIYGK